MTERKTISTWIKSILISIFLILITHIFVSASVNSLAKHTSQTVPDKSEMRLLPAAKSESNLFDPLHLNISNSSRTIAYNSQISTKFKVTSAASTKSQAASTYFASAASTKSQAASTYFASATSTKRQAASPYFAFAASTKNQAASTKSQATSPYFASAEDTNYGQITVATPLYRTDSTADSSYNNVIFMIPKSYYVEIISFQNETLAYIKYNETVGYIKTENLQQINFVPSIQKYIDATIKNDASTFLREQPTTTSQSIKIIPSGATGIKIIGQITGEKPTDGTTNTWYYCYYAESGTKLYMGYIYSERINGTITFPENQMSGTESSSSLTNEAATTKTNIDLPTISTGLKWLLIGLLSIPTIIVFVLLIKKPRQNIELAPSAAEYSKEIAPEISTKKQKFTKIKHKTPESYEENNKSSSSLSKARQRTPRTSKTIKSEFLTPKQEREYSQKSSEKPKSKSFVDRFFTEVPSYPDDDELL